MFAIFKKRHRELARVSITYESRIHFDEKYDLALAKFDIPKDLLLNFPGFPFGGFVRDVYHSDIPKDLDLFFISEANLSEVAKFLKQGGWAAQKTRQINAWEEGHYGEIIRKKSGYVKCFTKHGQKIDLFFKHRMISDREELAFLSQAYAWDLKLNRFFLWANPKSEHVEDIIFNQLVSKQLTINHGYAVWITKAHDRGILIQSGYLKEKIQSLLQKGWKLEFGKSNIFGNHLLLPRAKVAIVKMLPEKEVRSQLATYLTSTSPKIRVQVKDILQDYKPEIIANFLRKRDA